MSDPKRYELYVDASLQAEEGGEWVKWGDYAELQAQVERLTKAVMHSPAAQLKLKELEGKTTFEEINPKDDNSNITTELQAENARLKAEVERLTKAGDAMAAHIVRNDELCYIVAPDGDIRISEWHAAKEGKGQP